MNKYINKQILSYVMRDNVMLLMIGTIGISLLGAAAMFCGNNELAAVAVGSLAGLIGGHMNGSQVAKVNNG